MKLQRLILKRMDQNYNILEFLDGQFMIFKGFKTACKQHLTNNMVA